MRFRRKRFDPARERARAAFDPVAERVASAQRVLLAAIPTARDPGVPLAQALASFAAHLDAADAALDAVDLPGQGSTTCRDALAAARAQADHLRTEGSVLEFEALNARIGDVLAPLEDIADVERALRRG